MILKEVLSGHTQKLHRCGRADGCQWKKVEQQIHYSWLPQAILKGCTDVPLIYDP